MSKRRWLRPKPRISYFEPEEPNLDEYVFCEKCGDYVYEYCSIHGALAVIPDDKVPAHHNFPSFVPRAALTIPRVFLHLNYSSIPGAGLGVFTTLTLPKGVRFGPYRGVKTKEITSDYSWQIYDRDRKPCHVVDASDGNSSNWMRFVNCSRHWLEQNLVAYQYQGELYYRTIKIIPRYTELMVFYGSEFAKKLHIELGKYNAPKSYAQKFGARIPKNPKIFTENKTQDGSGPPTNEKENNTSRPTKDRPECGQLSATLTVDRPESGQPSATLTVGRRETGKPRTLNNTLAIPAQEKKNNRKRLKENQYEIKKERPAAKKRKTKVENKKLHLEQTIVEPVQQDTKIIRDIIEENNHTTKQPDEDVAPEKKNSKHDLIPKPREKNEINLGMIDTSNDKFIGKENISPQIQLKNYSKTSRIERNVDLIQLQNVYFVCNECNYQGVTKESLEKHMRLHDGNRKFACMTCGYRFCTSADFYQHNLIHKTKTRTSETLEKICEKPYSCDICNYKCVQASNLKTHLRIHSGEKPYSCDICNYKCVQASNLKTHLRIHSGEKPYSCDICNYKCVQAGNLKTHLRIHSGEKPYSCNICNNKFAEAGNLKRHLRLHSGEKPYSCNICNNKFAEAGDLKSHLRIHSGEKPYSCDICNYKSALAGTLKRHLRIHSGEKPYSCDICNYKSALAGNLKRHLRLHSGEKPYSCNICNNKFAEAGHLKRHLRIHSGEKPYSCDICDYKSSHSQSLKSHLVRKHLSPYTHDSP